MRLKTRRWLPELPVMPGFGNGSRIRQRVPFAASHTQLPPPHLGIPHRRTIPHIGEDVDGTLVWIPARVWYEYVGMDTCPGVGEVPINFQQRLYTTLPLRIQCTPDSVQYESQTPQLSMNPVADSSQCSKSVTCYRSPHWTECPPSVWMRAASRMRRTRRTRRTKQMRGMTRLVLNLMPWLQLQIPPA